MIYLDNNATTAPDSNVLNSITEEICNWYGNASSLHHYGQMARDSIDKSRASVASMLGAKSSNIFFTSGGTEANALALSGRVVYCSAVEHSSVLSMADEGAAIIRVNKDGTIDLNHLELILKGNIGMPICVAAMFANNETGIILDPLLQISALKDKYDFFYHIDAVQAVGKGISLDVDLLRADSLSISAHKFHGLKGCGALYVRNPSSITSLWSGGSQELGLRPGTENQIGILSIGSMCDKIVNNAFYAERIAGISRLRDLLESELSTICEVNGSDVARICNTSSLSIDSITDIELFADTLSELGVYVSGRAACYSGMPEPSKVLKAMFGPNHPKLENTLRVSLSVNTTATDVELAVEMIKFARENFMKENGANND